MRSNWDILLIFKYWVKRDTKISEQRSISTKFEFLEVPFNPLYLLLLLRIIRTNYQYESKYFGCINKSVTIPKIEHQKLLT